MNNLLVLAPALALLVGCDGVDHRPLTGLGDVAVDVYADLGAAWGTSTDDVHPGVQVSIEYTEPGCLSLEDDAEEPGILGALPHPANRGRQKDTGNPHQLPGRYSVCP